MEIPFLPGRHFREQYFVFRFLDLNILPQVGHWTVLRAVSNASRHSREQNRFAFHVWQSGTPNSMPHCSQVNFCLSACFAAEYAVFLQFIEQQGVFTRSARD
jgi:hypothetical protein